MKRKRNLALFQPIPAPIAERYAQLALLALEGILDILEGGVEWEIGRAVDAIIALFPDQPGLRKALGDYAAGVGGLASSQAAQSTLFLVAKVTLLIEQNAQSREDIADLKTIVRECRERLTEVEKGLEALEHGRHAD